MAFRKTIAALASFVGLISGTAVSAAQPVLAANALPVQARYAPLLSKSTSAPKIVRASNRAKDQSNLAPALLLLVIAGVAGATVATVAVVAGNNSPG